MRLCESARCLVGVVAAAILGVMVPVQAAPSAALRQACAAGDLAPVHTAIRNTPLPRTRMFTAAQEGTAAVQHSYFVFRSVPVGVRQRAGRSTGLLYGRQQVAFAQAQVLAADAPLPQDVDALLADWRLLAQGAARYLCVSDSFEMRSGRSQYVRYVYLWDLNQPARLYYDVLDVWPLVPGHGQPVAP